MCLQVAILILFFLDAIREMQKYGSEEQHQQQVWRLGWGPIKIKPNILFKGGHHTPGRSDADAHEALQSPEEFLHSWVCSYSARCIVDDILRFALFLFLVIKKLVSLISANAGLQVHHGVVVVLSMKSSSTGC